MFSVLMFQKHSTYCSQRNSIIYYFFEFSFIFLSKDTVSIEISDWHCGFEFGFQNPSRSSAPFGYCALLFENEMVSGISHLVGFAVIDDGEGILPSSFASYIFFKEMYLFGIANHQWIVL